MPALTMCTSSGAECTEGACRLGVHDSTAPQTGEQTGKVGSTSESDDQTDEHAAMVGKHRGLVGQSLW
eukprot:scaffold225052_cov21-Tisochrysis_lutea.AAC.1